MIFSQIGAHQHLCSMASSAWYFKINNSFATAAYTRYTFHVVCGIGIRSNNVWFNNLRQSEKQCIENFTFMIRVSDWNEVEWNIHLNAGYIYFSETINWYWSWWWWWWCTQCSINTLKTLTLLFCPRAKKHTHIECTFCSGTGYRFYLHNLWLPVLLLPTCIKFRRAMITFRIL